MKRMVYAAVLCALVLMLGACGSKNNQPSAERTIDTAAPNSQATAPQQEAPAAAQESVTEPPKTGDSEIPVVYFTSDISAAGLIRLYDQLGWEPSGNVAVKISTGEPPASNYLRPELIGDLIKAVNGTIVECNTAYGGSRASSAMHRQVAEDHGFTAIADFDLMDEEGEVEWPMTGGSRLDKVIVGSHAENYTDWVILSHFKGHAMAGFGGAIKMSESESLRPAAECMSKPPGQKRAEVSGTTTRMPGWKRWRRWSLASAAMSEANISSTST